MGVDITVVVQVPVKFPQAGVDVSVKAEGTGVGAGEVGLLPQELMIVAAIKRIVKMPSERIEPVRSIIGSPKRF